MGAAMRKAGYSASHAKNPHDLTRTRTWQELMDEYLPENKIASVLAEQLQATNLYILNGKVKEKPDNQARLKAVDIGLKLRGSYKNEEQSNHSFSLSELRHLRDSGQI